MARPRSALSKFVLSLPRDLSVKEVIAEAKAKGMKTSENNVYRIRRLVRAKTPRAATTRRAGAVRNGASVTRPIATMSSTEDLLRAVAAEIGLGRAVEILQGERARVRAAIAG